MIGVGPGVRARHILSVGLDLGLPTGALATLAAKSSAQNAYMVSCLLANHGFVYLEAPFIVQLLPAMLERDWGRVVFVSSDYGVQVNPDLMPYSVGKAAVIALARGLAVMTKGTGVTVNSAISGPTWTEGSAGFLDAANVEGRPVEEVKAEMFEPGGFLADTLKASATAKQLAGVEGIEEVLQPSGVR